VKFDSWISVLLSFAAGFVEAVCFVALFHLFATFITGTLMILIIEYLGGEPGYLNKSIVFLSFFGFTLVWAVIIRYWPWSADRKPSMLLFLEAGLIAIFAVTGRVLEPLGASDSLDTLILSVTAVFAMSLHGAVFFLVLNKRGHPPSHFMTGNLTNLSAAVVDGLLSPGADAELVHQARFKMMHFTALILAFAIGVAAGLIGLEHFGFLALIVPSLAVALAAAVGLRANQAAFRRP
jgi:uncharacterized membrane protein YoaK (UPF0700 family)